MGSPLSGSFKPLLYRRYVDDCFLLFRSLDHVPPFLSCLNRQHPNISYSSELEKDGRHPFLDIEITRSNGRFSTSVFNFHSFVPLAYKRSLVCCLLHRIFHFCSSYENFHARLEVVKKLFNLNGFPTHMFNQLVVTSSTTSSNPNHLSSQLPRKSSIFSFLSLVHIPFRFALKLHDFAVLLIVILTFALSFAPLHASPRSFPSRINFPSF